MAERQYRGTDVQMLLASNSIAERGIEHTEELSARRPQWKAPFFADLKTEIKAAMDKNIGVDILGELKQSTATVTNVMEAAHRDLMILKVEIEVGFKKNPIRMGTLLPLLGLDKLSSKNSKQSTYVNILLTLKRNLTPEIKTELVTGGASATTIEKLLLQAAQLIEANEKQESLKNLRKSSNSANVDELNAIYNKVIDICKLVSTYFVSNKILVEQFSFTNALKAQGYIPYKKKKEDPAKPTTK